MNVSGGGDMHYTLEFPGGMFLIIDSRISAFWDYISGFVNASGKYKFAIQSSRDKLLGAGAYTLVADMLPGSMYPVSVALVVSTTITDLGGYPHDIHEIYSYCKHTDAPKGAGSRLLNFLSGFTWNPAGPRFTNLGNRLLPYKDVPELNRIQADNSFVWLGVKEDEIALIHKVYMPANFYFPCILVKLAVKESVTPRNLPTPFRFYSGYSSKLIHDYLNSNWSKPQELAIAREDVMDMIGEYPSEDFGRLSRLNHETAGLFTTSGTMLKKEQAPDTIYRGQDESCHVYLTPTPSRFLQDRSLRIFSFHTHPFSCHRQAGLLLGFPSEPDYILAGSRQFNKYDDGSFVFSREGVFIIQYHPFVKYCINHTIMSQPMIEYIEGMFQAYLQSIQYGTKRLGANAVLKGLSKKIQEGVFLENREIKYIYDFDDASIQELLSDTTSFLLKYLNVMNIPPIFVQCIQRKQYAGLDNPTFIVSRARSRDPESW